MRRKKLILGVCAIAISVVVAGFSISAEANGKFTQLPAAGAAVAMGEGSSYVEVQASIESIVKENSNYANNRSAVGLQTIQNNVTVIRAVESIVSDEAATTVQTTQDIVNEPDLAVATSAQTIETQASVAVTEPVKAETVASSQEPMSEEQMQAAPVVIKVDTVVVNEETASESIMPIGEQYSEETTTLARAQELGSVGNADTESDGVAEVTPNHIIPTEELEIPGENVAVKEVIPEELQNLVIAQVDDYVNVRSEANTEAEIVGKLYDDSVGTLVKEENGWYEITSGNVTGYVKAEFCVTGEEALALVDEVGTEVATVNTTTLKVREEANTESSVIGLVPLGEELIVVKEETETEGWVKISIEEGEGYVSTEFVNLRTDFVKAESKEEEQQRLAQEAAARAAARAAAQQATSGNKTTTAVPTISGDSEMGVAVAQYACQFVGNPYVWGGTSLTNGADCSGFVMSVYANFGVSLPHSSTADRSQGYAVDGLANAQPGDLICYSGHVALYIGDGQIVHASSSKTGIIISNADYKKILAIRRIF